MCNGEDCTWTKQRDDYEGLTSAQERIAAAANLAPPEPGYLNPMVVAQDQWWYDIKSRRHNLDTMDIDYILNVLCFCYEHPGLRGSFAVRGGFIGSPLQKKLYDRLKEACEKADRYDGLCV